MIKTIRDEDIIMAANNSISAAEAEHMDADSLEMTLMSWHQFGEELSEITVDTLRT